MKFFWVTRYSLKEKSGACVIDDPPRGEGVLNIFVGPGCAVFLFFAYVFYNAVSKEGNFSGASC